MAKGTATARTGEKLLAELDRLEAELAELREELDRSAQLASLGTLLGLIAHEFNNILTPVQGYAAAALQRPEDTPFAIKALERAASGSARAAEIAGAILALSADPRYRPAGEGERTCDPLAAFRSIVSTLQLEGVQIQIEAPTEPLRVSVMPAVMQQVLQNLVLNAVRAMGGVGRLTFRLSRSTGNTVQLELGDTGCGIPASRLATLFDAYVTHADGAAVCPLPRSGTGLGLALCHRFVTAAGGTIRVTSELGRGSTFVLTVPEAAE
ncbi:MAG: sensor histidine kinase [Phycisphaerales bacterium]|nr:MAG: sensor histidine kinase [Phycisphaerales bacterium]